MGQRQTDNTPGAKVSRLALLASGLTFTTGLISSATALNLFILLTGLIAF